MIEELSPLIQPFQTGILIVADGNQIYWEVSGNPKGKPAIYLHGGPGSGLGSGAYRQRFDPERYLVVGIDQRGCGRSRPLVGEDLASLKDNTTHAVIRDIEAVREHLGIDRWLVAGISWGATLALAYAQAKPDAVSELVLMAVTTTGRAEVDWITEGVGRLFPEAWERFERGAQRRKGERVVEAYARRLAGTDPQDRLEAARGWNDWETTHVSLDPNWTPIDKRFDEAAAVTFATLVSHYWANDAFLPGDQAILERVALLRDIPAILIHGRRDYSGPVITPWRLHSSWPSSRLVIVEAEGHGGPESMRQMQIALDSFAR